jgi:hypothetical protein
VAQLLRQVGSIRLSAPPPSGATREAVHCGEKRAAASGARSATQHAMPSKRAAASECSTAHDASLASCLQQAGDLRLTRPALEGAERGAEDARDWQSLRAKYVNAAMRDGKGGDSSTAVRHYLRFCIKGRRISPVRECGPSSPLAEKLEEESMLMDFALWLVLCKPLGNVISIDTASSYVGTVQAWHERRFGTRIGAGLELTRLRDMLKGMRREIGQPERRRRFGVRTQQLAEGIRRFFAADGGAASTQQLNAINWRAALSVAFCALLRAAEFALEPKAVWNGELNLSRADVSFFTDEDGVRCAALMMRPCKNGKYLRGKSCRVVLRGGGSLLDPVAELWRLVHEDPVPKSERASTPLFRTRSGSAGASCVTVAEVRSIIKEMMRALGEDERLFGAHSLRIGGASAALAAGVPPSVIRLCGRWNSDLWEIYARISREAAANMTSVIGSTPFHDLERGFHADELELLPDEMAVQPEFEDEELEIEMM